jgi:hypothetical protein
VLIPPIICILDFYLYMLNFMCLYTIASLAIAVGANVYGVCLDVQHFRSQLVVNPMVLARTGNIYRTLASQTHH